MFMLGCAMSIFALGGDNAGADYEGCGVSFMDSRAEANANGIGPVKHWVLVGTQTGVCLGT